LPPLPAVSISIRLVLIHSKVATIPDGPQRGT
jgi:hypothetical protein